MRIGTWNLEGRWDGRHLALIEEMACDVLLLTEVPERVEIPGMTGHLTADAMAPRRRWAAIFSGHAVTPLPDPHPASVMVAIAGTRYCASILPWRSCGAGAPWDGSNVAERTASAVLAIELSRPEVWGGDWNHALSGTEWAGSTQGRMHITNAVERLGLSVPTTGLPHRRNGLLSIDHVAVPKAWRVQTAQRYVATSERRQISDHDAYVIEVDGPAPSDPTQSA